MAHSPLWGLPFLGMLLSIALLPAVWPGLWHRRMDAVTVAWSLALLVPQAIVFGPHDALAGAWRAVLVEYLPLICLLFGLYVAGGGILIDGGPFGTPRGNLLLMAGGTVLAGLLGTTGASMVLIRPLLRANAHRTRRAHLAIFFILLVSNAGGGTMPLGDPPLFVGFLHGVPLFWPLTHLLRPLLLVIIPLLATFYMVDRIRSRGEAAPPPSPLRLTGAGNLLLVGMIGAGVLVQGVWSGPMAHILGQPIAAARLLGMVLSIGVASQSLLITPAAVREANGFGWAPIHEVAVLFAGLFITVEPVLAMFQAGPHGALAGLFAITHDARGAPIPWIYFWLTGVLAGFLDNAPTYLVFFQQAGGDAAVLTGAQSRTLIAISAGSVLFGGLSYIGNAPNLMVRAIAEHQGVRMPNFLAYVVIASALLLPGLAAVSLIFLR